jgi:hypothetical protein
MDPRDVEIQTETAKSLASTAQLHLTISAVLMSVSLFLGIVLWRWPMLVFAALWALNARRQQRERNRNMRLLRKLRAEADPAALEQ